MTRKAKTITATARTSEINHDVADRILQSVADGKSLNKSAIAEGSDRRRFLEWCEKDSDLADKYVRARRFCSDAGRDKMIDIRDKVESGELDPASARVIIDSLKWEMCKLNPRVYGEKLELEHSGSVELDATKVLSELGGLLESAMKMAEGS